MGANIGGFVSYMGIFIWWLLFSLLKREAERQRQVRLLQVQGKRSARGLKSSLWETEIITDTYQCSLGVLRACWNIVTMNLCRTNIPCCVTFPAAAWMQARWFGMVGGVARWVWPNDRGSRLGIHMDSKLDKNRKKVRGLMGGGNQRGQQSRGAGEEQWPPWGQPAGRQERRWEVREGPPDSMILDQFPEMLKPQLWLWRWVA